MRHDLPFGDNFQAQEKLGLHSMYKIGWQICIIQIPCLRRLLSNNDARASPLPPRPRLLQPLQVQGPLLYRHWALIANEPLRQAKVWRAPQVPEDVAHVI